MPLPPERTMNACTIHFQRWLASCGCVMSTKKGVSDRRPLVLVVAFGSTKPRTPRDLISHLALAIWWVTEWPTIQTKLMNQDLQFGAISVIVDDLQGNSYPTRRPEFNSSLGALAAVFSVGTNQKGEQKILCDGDSCSFRKKAHGFDIFPPCRYTLSKHALMCTTLSSFIGLLQYFHGEKP